MLFLPPATVEQKVAALRWHLPGMNLHAFLKGMPTALARSQKTIPRGLSQLRKVSHDVAQTVLILVRDILGGGISSPVYQPLQQRC